MSEKKKHTYGAAYVMQMSIFIVIHYKKCYGHNIFVMNLCAHIMVYVKQFWLAVRYIWRGSGG